MHQTILAAASVLLFAAGPALAADSNYNANAGGNNNNQGQANCHSATQQGGCVTEAPLPLLGAGVIGAILLGGAGTASVLLRRRRERQKA